jgi:hypothetical protein
MRPLAVLAPPRFGHRCSHNYMAIGAGREVRGAGDSGRCSVQRRRVALRAAPRPLVLLAVLTTNMGGLVEREFRDQVLRSLTSLCAARRWPGPAGRRCDGRF